MSFTVKDWRNATTYAGGGDESTPLSAEALEDLEERVTDYADDQLAELAFNVKTYGAAGDGAADDTAEIQAAIDAATTAATSAGSQVEVVFPPGTYLTDGIFAKSNVHLNFGSALIQKRPAAASVRGILYAAPVLDGSTYWGEYENIKVSGGTFDPNGYASNLYHVVNLMFVDGLEMENCTVLHDPSNASWAYCLGANRLRFKSLNVRNGTELFQDGIHIVHGDDIVGTVGVSEVGDDGIALGGEPTDPYLGADPTPLRNVSISSGVVDAAKGAALKIYTQSGATGADWEISDVMVTGLTGRSGQSRNGGISVIDLNAGAAGAQIKRIHVSASLKVGSTSHDETNAYGVWAQSIEDLSVAGSMTITDDASPSPGFQLYNIADCEDLRLDLKCETLPANGAGTIADSTVVRLADAVVRAGSVVVADDNGTYTPALTNVANLDSSTAYQCQYLRVGNTVTVSGKVDLDATANGTFTRVGVALPIASNLGAEEDCAGAAVMNAAIAHTPLAVIGDATNNRAELAGQSASTAARSYFFTFTYQVI